MLNKLSAFNIMFLRQKKTNKQTNTKGHWVLDVMMFLIQTTFTRNEFVGPILQRNHILNKKMGLNHHMGRIPLKRKDWPINIDFEQEANKEFRKCPPFMYTYMSKSSFPRLYHRDRIWFIIFSFCFKIS